MATINTKAQFNKELDTIVAMLNNMILSEGDKNAFLNVVNILRGRADELADAATKAMLLADLDTLKKGIVDKFGLDSRNNILHGLDYAMSSSDLLEVSRLIVEFHSAPEDKKFDCLKDLLMKINTVVNTLKADGILKDDATTNVGTMTNRQAKKFKEATATASNFHRTINALKEELAHAADEKDVVRIVGKIDNQLKIYNSTNRRLEKLRKKVGNIEPHQRSIKAKAADIARLRNQAVADELYDSPEINGKLEKLATAYEKEQSAASSSELYRAKKEVKRAEREIYGKRLTRRRAEKIDRAYEQRREIIANAQATMVTGNHDYHKKFKQTMKQLEKVDKKIIGKRNAKEMYWGRNGLRSKAGYLVGGTSITLPKQVVELENSIKSASR